MVAHPARFSALWAPRHTDQCRLLVAWPQATQPRVACWFALGQRVILLAVFRKTRSAEVARAPQARKICETEGGPTHETFDREARRERGN